MKLLFFLSFIPVILGLIVVKNLNTNRTYCLEKHNETLCHTIGYDNCNRIIINNAEEHSICIIELPAFSPELNPYSKPKECSFLDIIC
jgi:hypothetical protein